ncbi:DUF6894 family protein [Rhizobium sp. YIM 134829]|uniref:DUF6894 family protein n=1 Tax=Rhizobium sp. YIM 134829 TaxID=3390453 RepID=UPI0039794D57
MKVKFFTDDGRRIDEDGGAEFFDQAAAEREALLGLMDWAREQKVDELPFKGAVIASDGDGRPLFRLTLRASIDRFDGRHSEPKVDEALSFGLGSPENR